MTTVNYILTSQPITIIWEWIDQTIVLANHPRQWTCIGSRWDLVEHYGCDEFDTALSDVNGDLIFVPFPFDLEPACPGVTDPHDLKADVDYPVNAAKLPRGLIQFESVRITYSD